MFTFRDKMFADDSQEYPETVEGNVNTFDVRVVYDKRTIIYEDRDGDYWVSTNESNDLVVNRTDIYEFLRDIVEEHGDV